MYKKNEKTINCKRKVVARITQNIMMMRNLPCQNHSLAKFCKFFFQNNIYLLLINSTAFILKEKRLKVARKDEKKR